MAIGESEFGGVDGVIQKPNYDHMNPNEELMTVYATRIGNPEETDPEKIAETVEDPARVGLIESYGDDVGWNHG